MGWWVVNDRTLSSGFDVIVAISYGTTPTSLTKGNAEVLNTAGTIYQNNKNERTLVAWGVFTPTADMEGNPERAFREKHLKELGVTLSNQIYIGCVASTIEEAVKTKQALLGRSFHAILVIAGAGHSRRARLVWKREFPESEIKVVSFPWQQETQKDNPMVALRNRWSWLLVNMVLHLIFLTPFGYAYFRKNRRTMRQLTAI
ncbi:MAG: hypothetical protein UY07_C0003G0014 [Parcubacteria group bacterium GW2011_GWA1_47_8]|nr:MAG: hypothetical protein UY07_C0003G0014 [Parcubacteria group bacterium GW2011_GWA1_47_8]